MHFYTYLNNRQTGKDATKPRALGLLGHSVIDIIIFSGIFYIEISLFIIANWRL